MAEDSSSTDDLLLLDLQLSTDEDDFSRAKSSLAGLKNEMSGIGEETFGGLKGLIDKLDVITKALKDVVKLYDALETKAVAVADARAGEVYGLTPGQMTAVLNNLGTSKVASAAGLTADSFTSALSSVRNWQSATLTQGADVNAKQFIAVSESAKAVGRTDVTKDLGKFMLESNPAELLLTLSDIDADLLRKQLAAKGEKNKAKYRNLRAGLISTGLLPESVARYNDLLVKEGSAWALDGNPLASSVYGNVADATNYGKRLDKSAAGAASREVEVNAMRSDIDEAMDAVKTATYNVLTDIIVAPVTQSVDRVAGVVSGKNTAPSFSWGALGNSVQFAALSAEQKAQRYAAVGFGQYGKQPTYDQEAFVTQLKASATANEQLPLRQENESLEDYNRRIALGALASEYAQNLALTEKTANASDVKALELDRLYNIVLNKERKANKNISFKEAQQRASQLVLAPDSSIATAYRQGGSIAALAVMRDSNYITEKEYLRAIADMANAVNDKTYTKYIDSEHTSVTEITNAKVKSDKEGTSRLEVTVVVKDEGGHTQSTQKVMLNAEDASKILINAGGN